MLIKPITYTTFDGVEVTENFYFNLTQAELQLMMLKSESRTSNFEKAMNAIKESGDGALIVPEFEKIIAMTYGLRSDDGKIFRKSDEISADFKNHAAYDVLINELLSSQGAMENFINQVMPPALVAAASREAQQESNTTTEITATAEPVLEKTPSQLAREASEANMQGHKQKATVAAPTPQPVLVEEDDPAQARVAIEHNQLMEDERRELEELRRLRDQRAGQ